MVYSTRRRANYARSDGCMYWNAGQALQCVDGAFCQPMPEEMVHRGMPFGPEYVAIEQLADQARSIRPAAKRVRAMEQWEELDAAGRIRSLETARAGLGGGRPELTPRSPSFTLRRTPEKRNPGAGTPAGDFHPRRRKLPSPLAGRGPHGVASSSHSSSRSQVNAKSRNCNPSADPRLLQLSRRGHHGQGPQSLLRRLAEETSPTPAGEASSSAGEYDRQILHATPSFQLLSPLFDLCKNARFDAPSI